MSELSIRVESIALSSSPTTSSGQISTPNRQDSAQRGGDPLSTVQVAARIGDPVPVVFCRRVSNAGGLLISPKATEARFSNDSSNDVTAHYHLLLSEGQLDGIQVRDVFQQSCRVGTFTQAYDRRAGNWGPGNFITSQTGFEDQVPDAPIFCGSGTGSYAGVTTGSFTVTIPHPFTQWDRQVHAFIRGGMHVERFLEAGVGPSNNIADLVLWLLQRSSRVPNGLIDYDALEVAARFTNANGLWCNIEVKEPENLADWLSSRLGYFLLRESRRGGKKGLRPLLPFNEDGTINVGAVQPVYTFNEDNILPGSFEINYASRVERQPFCVQVIWRQQPDNALGLARTAEVRYFGSALEGPFEQHDLTEFCTTEDHAFKVGAYILARRRHIDHRLAFSVRSDAFNSTLAPGDIVRVRLRRIASVGDPQVHDYLYEVDRIGRGVTGEITLELTHYPVDAQGRSIVAYDVSFAQGNGLLLPTGRAPVNCDLNSFENTNVEFDLGPWTGWEIGAFDPVLFDLDDLDGWEYDLDLDVWVPDDDVPGWEYDPDLDVWVPDDDVPGWEYDPDLDVWVPTDPEPGDPEPGPQPGPQPGPRPDIIPDSGDGWGPGLPGFENPDLDIEDWGIDDLSIGDRNGTVGFSSVVVTYPDVWYAILEPFALARFKVTVTPAPENTPLRLTIADGSVNDFNPEAGQFGGENVYTVTIPVGETSSALIAINVKGDSVDSNTSRSLKVVNFSGGSYEQGEEGEPPLDVTATGDFQINAYVGTISLQQPGVWTYDEGWIWGGGETGDFEWDEEDQEWTWNGTDTDWSWDVTNQRWSYSGSVSGWSWQAGTQRWLRTTDAESADPKPSQPPAGPPSAVPDSLPPSEGVWQSIVANATVDNVPTDLANSLNVDINHIEEDQETNVITSKLQGSLVIPGVPMMFGSNWRWNPATTGWEYRNAPSDWLWTGAAWEYIGADTGGWSWSIAEGWEWTGEDEAEGSAPSTEPPTHNNSIHPPDAERWEWTGSAWSGTAHIEGGSAPFFDGLLSGSFTYHVEV
jgi:hypothetical protein